MSKNSHHEEEGRVYEILGETIRLPQIGTAVSARESLADDEFMVWLNHRLALARGEGRMQEANEAHQRLIQEFWQRHGLGEKDEIRPNGTIVRAPVHEER